MNKRIRKKHRVGEFRELGFEVRFTLPDTMDDDAADAMVERFGAEAITANGLAFFGSGLRTVEGIVIAASRSSATEEQRAAVEAWLSAQDGIDGHQVGPLMDAWHG